MLPVPWTEEPSWKVARQEADSKETGLEPGRSWHEEAKASSFGLEGKRRDSLLPVPHCYLLKPMQLTESPSRHSKRNIWSDHLPSLLLLRYKYQARSLLNKKIIFHADPTPQAGALTPFECPMPTISTSRPLRQNNTPFHFKHDSKEHKSWQTGIIHSTCVPKEIWESAPDLLDWFSLA